VDVTQTPTRSPAILPARGARRDLGPALTAVATSPPVAQFGTSNDDSSVHVQQRPDSALSDPDEVVADPTAVRTAAVARATATIDYALRHRGPGLQGAVDEIVCAVVDEVTDDDREHALVTEVACASAMTPLTRGWLSTWPSALITSIQHNQMLLEILRQTFDHAENSDNGEAQIGSDTYANASAARAELAAGKICGYLHKIYRVFASDAELVPGSVAKLVLGECTFASASPSFPLARILLMEAPAFVLARIVARIGVMRFTVGPFDERDEEDDEEDSDEEDDTSLPASTAWSCDGAIIEHALYAEARALVARMRQGDARLETMLCAILTSVRWLIVTHGMRREPHAARVDAALDEHMRAMCPATELMDGRHTSMRARILSIRSNDACGTVRMLDGYTPDDAYKTMWNDTKLHLQDGAMPCAWLIKASGPVLVHGRARARQVFSQYFGVVIP